MLRNKCKKIINFLGIFLLIVNLTSCSDGRKLKGALVFSSNRNERFDSFILENGRIQLLKKDTSSPVWSFDGKLIACDKVGKKGDEDFGFYIFNKGGDYVEFIPTESVVSKLLWGKDKILYIMSVTPQDIAPNAIWEYDHRTKIHTKIFETKGNLWVSRFNLTSDCKKIVYSLSDNKRFGFSGSFIYEIDTKKNIEIGRCHKPTWYPDGKHILCIMHPEKDKHEIGTYWGHFTKYNVETGEKKYLARVPFLELSGMKISGDGEYLYYAGPESIYISPMDDLSKRERITEPVRTRSGWSDDKSPDWYRGK